MLACRALTGPSGEVDHPGVDETAPHRKGWPSPGCLEIVGLETARESSHLVSGVSEPSTGRSSSVALVSRGVLAWF